MKSDLAEYLFAVIAVVVGAAAEELLPRIGPVGFPVLLMATAVYASGARIGPAVAFALAAGAVEESLSGLPPTTGMVFFAAVAVLARRVAVPRWAAALAYPAFQVWLWVWTIGTDGGVFGRLLAAVPTGFAAAYSVAFALERFGKAVALGEAV